MANALKTILIAISALVAAASSAVSAELVMFEQAGCAWCMRWNQEIGPAYPNTAEGKIAPLRRIDIHKPLPEDLVDIRVERFTPTFVLVEDGKEIARMRGYTGDEFFWFLLNDMLKKIEPTGSG